MFEQIEKNLLKFEKPGRYIGGEIGIPPRDFKNSDVRFAIAYPDVYDIGMSNSGIKIIYDVINKIDFASCERVFNPWTDFNDYLKENNIPLFSLETKTPIKDFDIFGISMQYELLFTNFFNLLDRSFISVYNNQREESDPIIICGGPVTVNPAPLSPFADLIVVGEGEEVVNEIVHVYSKNKHKKRMERIEALSNIEGCYSPLFPERKVRRAVYSNFTKDTGVDNFVIPFIEIVQNKLVVEIMRGCPNSCRFCQAGTVYKPFREKNASIIMKNIENGISKTGLSEITLSSLSSGDYSHILELSDVVNGEYASKGISVSLPSLKVESFNTDILDRISEVRKSGLTFAIESGSEAGQKAINKYIDIEKIYSILDKAIEKGWKLVKFYFMLGLPDDNDDVNNIKAYIDNILKKYRKLFINLNIAVFVPKPHTPYQWDKQLTLQESIEKIDNIKKYYRGSRVKVKSHDPHMSYIEGFISRGDAAVGRAIYEVYKNGGLFDGWNDKFNFKLYESVFSENNILYDKYLTAKGFDSVLSWDCVDNLVSKDFLIKEKRMSLEKKESILCKEKCDKECGVCGDGVSTNRSDFDYVKPVSDDINKSIEKTKNRYFIEFNKSGLLRYLSHIDTIRYFENLFKRSGIMISHTEGFNPHPRMQFSGALSLGVSSECEVLEIFTDVFYEPDYLFKKIKRNEHKDLSVNRIRSAISTKKISLIETVKITEYILFFNKLYYTEIKHASDEFNCGKAINVMLKDKLVKLNDFVMIENVKDSNLKIIINKIVPSPRIFDIVGAVFGEFIDDIHKCGMYYTHDGKKRSLYDAE